MQAQNKNIKVLAKSKINYETCPKNTKMDDKTNKEAVVWYSTNNAWIKEFCWADNVPIEKNIDNYFPSIKWRSKEDTFAPMAWMLTEEDNNTVLHCYMKMPADEVTNLWIANEETGILDKETGVLYRARRTVPNVFGKHFGVRAQKGDVLDLQVFFPRLPKSVRKISIYGVQNWGLSGYYDINIDRKPEQPNHYDSVPSFSIPKVVKPEKDYEKNDMQTWAVYDNVQLVKPVADHKMALWLTPEATYLAIMYEQNWMTEYWGFPSETILVDQSDIPYQLREIQGLPIKHQFLIKGYSGDYIAFLFKFAPMPLNTTTITYFEPSSKEPLINAWGANNDPVVFSDLNVKELRANQRLFDYHKRVVVK